MCRRVLAALLGILSLTACSPEGSVESSSQTPDPTKVGEPIKLDEMEMKFREGLLTALENYNNLETERGYKNYYAQSLSMAGRSDIPHADKVLRASRNICKVSEGNKAGSPIEEALRLVGQHNVVIINEHHSMPRDRAVILDLLKGLKDKGFTHYAAETFQETLKGDGPKFGVIGDGYYSNEPIFGRVVTYAKTAGFKLIPYEMKFEQMPPEGTSMSEQVSIRENAQSDNLIASVLKDAPDTKMIIHVGHSHVAELPIKRGSNDTGTKWMAALLKEKTGINPLTISQTACRSEGGSSLLSAEIYDKDDAIVNSLTDYAIGHPPLSFTKNRPDWRRKIGDIDIAVPSELLAFGESVIIEARLENQPDSAVPMDRLLLREGEGDIPLLLPLGRYRIEAFNKTERLGDIEYVVVETKN